MNLKTQYNDLIKIRPLTKEDFKYVLNWSKDNRFCSANDWEENRSEKELYHWWLHCVNNKSEDFIRLGIELENKLIGYADLAYIKENSAELGIAIGESLLWGKGIGIYSSLNMIDYASTHLGITVFNAETHETNIRARKMLEKIGFKEVSRIGSEKYLGKDCNLIQFQLSLQANK
ncbi:GNAT family N-acetyltransferase [Macrococcus armenti]|uniref:GNAT family N-acetyltransferase n=1 Tax=Macrococcus armenti TaxID=2875764 RepID=UPI001CC9CCCE|nr:GNAT family N-acetyltransferase [Macrococcus armenti]UBH14986.1 GNAT family N-acetyltransferase [Macrococcus armenti]UBH17345.1 GNAT family N-acetyltransferase [Macrococcus armenti]UBH19610.1 GNAT family N-acetyltransferase [Macrococcus armenti]